jgi:hypothetical protein
MADTLSARVSTLERALAKFAIDTRKAITDTNKSIERLAKAQEKTDAQLRETSAEVKLLVQAFRRSNNGS